MREDHDRSAGLDGRQIALQPIELVAADLAEAFQLLRVVECHEMDAAVVEAIPARPHAAFAEPFERSHFTLVQPLSASATWAHPSAWSRMLSQGIWYKGPTIVFFIKAPGLLN